MSAQFPLPLPYLRTQEAGRFIGVSSRTLEKHRIYGTGPKYSKVGGRIVYAVCDLREWVELGVKHSTSDLGRATVLPAKPVEVNLAEQVRDDEMAVEVEAAGPAKSVGEANDPVSEGETVGEVKATWPALPGTLEAARFVGVSTRTLEKYRIYGTGPKYSKVGRRIVYAISDLKEWVERGAKRSTSDPGRVTVLPAIPADGMNLVEPVRNRRRVIVVDDAWPAWPDTHEAARLLGLSHRTLERYRVSGAGPKYSKIGRRVVYAISDLKEWAECRASRSTSDPGRTSVLPTTKSDGGVR